VAIAANGKEFLNPTILERATKFGWPFSRDEILEKLYELGGQWMEVKAALEQPSPAIAHARTDHCGAR
jgi:hypothetical protein